MRYSTSRFSPNVSVGTTPEEILTTMQTIEASVISARNGVNTMLGSFSEIRDDILIAELSISDNTNTVTTTAQTIVNSAAAVQSNTDLVSSNKTAIDSTKAEIDSIKTNLNSLYVRMKKLYGNLHFGA